MSDIDPIAAARALIEPLTGYTPGPWRSRGRYIGTPRHASYIGECRDINGNWTDREPASDNARLIAAAPDLRDMVATLADALEAERAENQRLCDALEAARRESFDAGFDAGFAASGEGWNFEYPFQDHGIEPRNDQEWSNHAMNARDVWLSRFQPKEASQ